jgi:aspartyl-tRNA(Asn)/glutamyl-tRNA(Gln) amidotransferase subunit A
LDSIGPIAKTVDQCARAYSALSSQTYSNRGFPTLHGLRLGAVQGLPLECIDQTVGEGYERALSRLSAAGAIVVGQEIPELDGMADVNRLGGLVPAEAYHVHRDIMENGAQEIDPNIRQRLESGRAISATDYLRMLERRRELMEAVRLRMQHLDALVMPTTPIVAPTFKEVSAPDGFREKNSLLLRNTSIANFFGLASISLPVPETRLPVGLMLTAGPGEDERLLSMARTIEAFLQPSSSGR